MDDLVILDEEIAWRLYGGTNLAGMPVTINGEHFLIGGVVAWSALRSSGAPPTGG